MNATGDLWKLADMVRNAGLHSGVWAQTVASTAAAVRLLWSDDGGELLTSAEELTVTRWLDLMRRAEDAWWMREKPAESEGRKVSPFEHFSDPHRLPPGYFEALRRGLSSAAGTSANGDDPVDFFDLCVDIARLANSRLGAFSLREGASELVAALLSKVGSQTAYCAFQASGEVALRLARAGLRVTLDIPVHEEASLWGALAIASTDDLQVRNIDPFSELVKHWPVVERQYDVVFVVPPFNSKVTGGQSTGMGFPPPTSEAWGVALAGLHSKAIGACLLPNGFLFRTSLSDQSFKDKAIGRFGLNTVIAFPAGLILEHSGLQISLALLAPEVRVADVLMVDVGTAFEGRRAVSAHFIEAIASIVDQRAEGRISRRASYEEIAANNFNLMPERYVLSEDDIRLQALVSGGDAVTIDEIADLYRAQATPPSLLVDSAVYTGEGELVYELAVSDLDETGLAARPSKHLLLDPATSFKVRKAQLQPGDVLVVIKGSVGRIGFVDFIPEGHVWVANQSFAIVRLRKTAPLKDSRVLFRFLSSGVGQSLISRLKVGSGVATLQMADLRKLSVLVPSVEQQWTIGGSVAEVFRMQAEITALRDRLAELQHSLWPDQSN